MVETTGILRVRLQGSEWTPRRLLPGVSALALVLATSQAMAADVDVAANTTGVNLDTFAGTTVRVIPGVTVSEAGVKATTQAWSLTNDGTIIGLSIPFGALNAVNFAAGGTLENNAGALIEGAATGALFGKAAPSTVTNAGTIRGVSGGEGVTLTGGGTVNNLASGRIETKSSFNALSIGGTTIRVVNNAGRIFNTQTTGFATGILVQGGAAEITNASTGKIDASYNGIFASNSAPLTLNNAGVIESLRGPTVEMLGGGSVVNTGVIQNIGVAGSANVAILFQGAGGITNSGAISTTNGPFAIDFRGAVEHTLTLDTGSQIIGNVRGGTGVDNLVLQGTGVETLPRFSAFENLSMNGVEWRLQGAGSFSGGTTITAGKLFVDDALTTPTVSVAAGATLGGTGTITGNLANSGAVAPGNSVGEITINGNASFAAGSSLVIELNDGGSTPGVHNDRLIVMGATTITGGNVHVRPENGTDTGATYAPGTTYTILSSAGGVTGAFDTITDDFPLLDFTPGGDANNVSITSNLVANFCIAGSTINQCAAGEGIQSLGGGPLFNSVLPLNEVDAKRAFDLVSGDIYASMGTFLVLDSRFPREAAIDRLSAALDDGVGQAPQPGVRNIGDNAALWVRGYGSWGRIDGDGNVGGVKRSTGGVFTGVDAGIGRAARLGAFIGYGSGSFDASSRNASWDVKTFTIGGYGGVQIGGFGLRAGASVGIHDINIRRQIIFPGFQDTVTGSRDAQTTQVFAEASQRFEAGGFRFEPFANLAYVNVTMEALQERGGAAALSVRKTHQESAFTTLGVRAETNFTIVDVPSKLRVMAGWRHSFSDSLPASMNALTGGAPFLVRGIALDNDAFVAEAGAEFRIAKDGVLRVSYSAQLGATSRDQGVRATVDLRF